MIKFQPWPEPNPEWPDVTKSIYLNGCRRIDELRKELDQETGALPLPFTCFLCDNKKMNVSICHKEGYGICSDCVEPFEESLEAVNDRT